MITDDELRENYRQMLTEQNLAKILMHLQRAGIKPSRATAMQIVDAYRTADDESTLYEPEPTKLHMSL